MFCLFFSASRCPALCVLSGGCCPPPPPLLCLAVLVAPAGRLGVFFSSSSLVRPRCLRLSLVSGPGCPGPRRCALFALLAFRFSALRAPSPLSCFPPGRWLLPGGCCPPPPLCVSQFSSLQLRAVWRALCCAVCPWVRCFAALLRVVPPGVVLSCAVFPCCALLVPLLVAPCPLALPVALGPCALRHCVLRCSPALCVPCCVCLVLARWCVLLFPVLSALCGAVLRCAGALALCCSCGACCCWRLVLWCAAVCCDVSFGVTWCGAGSDGPWLFASGVFGCRCPCLAAWSASLWLVWFACKCG